MSFFASMNRIIFLFSFLVACPSCSSLKPIEYRSLKNFNVSALTSRPELSFDLHMFNPNSFGAKLKDFKLELLIGNAKVAEVKLDEVARAAANSEFSIPIGITTSLSDIALFLPAGIELFKSGSMIPIKINGSVTVKKFLFKKTFPLQFEESIDPGKLNLKK